MDTQWKVVYDYMRERRCSSSTLSSGSGSTPPHDRLQQFHAMKDDQPPELEDTVAVMQFEIQTEDDMWDFMNLAQAGQADKYHETTHLKIVVNSTNFGDWEDDIWYVKENFSAHISLANHLSPTGACFWQTLRTTPTRSTT